MEREHADVTAREQAEPADRNAPLGRSVDHRVLGEPVERPPPQRPSPAVEECVDQPVAQLQSAREMEARRLEAALSRTGRSPTAIAPRIEHGDADGRRPDVAVVVAEEPPEERSSLILRASHDSDRVIAGVGRGMSMVAHKTGP